jgi:hypothetical protein
MQWADKFIILPIDQYSRLKKQSEKTVAPISQETSVEVQATSAVPHNTPSSNNSDAHQGQPQFDEEAPKAHAMQMEFGTLIESMILSTLPKMYRSKSAALLKYLKGELKWSPSGELIIDGTPVKDSHITDLLRDIQRQFKKFHPKGHNRFWKMVQKINCPEILDRQRTFL